MLPASDTLRKDCVFEHEATSFLETVAILQKAVPNHRFFESQNFKAHTKALRNCNNFSKC